MYEIIGLSVISALGAEITKVFPGARWQRETVTNPQFPHFFVQQLSASSSEERKNHWWLDYLMNVQYRIAANPQAVGNLLEQLNNIGAKMKSDIQNIYWDNVPVRIRNPRYEIQEGILQYTCNVRVQGTKTSEEYTKMLEFEQNTNMVGGN